MTLHLLLISRMGDGKSTFAAQMDPDYIVLDFDGRWVEQKDNQRGTSHVIQNNDVLEAVYEMNKHLKSVGDKVKTVVIDSGTAVLDYIQAMGRLEEDKAKSAGRKFNINMTHRLKADTMRVLKGAVQRFHANSLWIFHLEDGMYGGKEKVRTTIPSTELERLKQSLNAVITIVTNKSGMRGVRIEWCRYHKDAAAGSIIWDTQGMWKGVPEKLEQFIHGFDGDAPYKGRVYSYEVVVSELKKKGISSDVESMQEEYGEPPAWWDRDAWVKILDTEANGPQ